MESSRSTRCSQGRISLFSAEVQTSQHIQAAVKFGAQHNLKLAIRNTGHDFLGRSSAPHSLQIFTHHLRNISVHDSFVPFVPSHIRAPKGVKAVTLGAGVQLREMYEYLSTHGLMVVGGSSNTVGAAGGYIQGGGHSIMGWLHGMASDNALEFQVVIADVSTQSLIMFYIAENSARARLFLPMRIKTPIYSLLCEEVAAVHSG